VEVAQRDTKKGTATDNDHWPYEYRRHPRKTAKMMTIFKKTNEKDIENFRPICLLSNVYKVPTEVVTKRLKKTSDEMQPRGQTGPRSGHSTQTTSTS